MLFAVPFSSNVFADYSFCWYRNTAGRRVLDIAAGTHTDLTRRNLATGSGHTMLPPNFLILLIQLSSWTSTSTDHALEALIDEA